MYAKLFDYSPPPLKNLIALESGGGHIYLAPVLDVECTVDIVEYFTLLVHLVSLSTQGLGY